MQSRSIISMMRMVMSQLMTLAAAACAERFVTIGHRANEGFLSSMRTKVLLQCTLLIPSFATTCMITNERLFACVYPHVDLQMGRPQKALTAATIQTHMRFRAVVSFEVIHQISFGRK